MLIRLFQYFIYTNIKVMKTNKILIVLGIVFVAAMSRPLQAGPDTVSMGSSYASDVYYSMENGTLATVVRETWDLAFSTKVFSASILINDGSGATLYTWANGDTSGWNTIDTAGMAGWAALYNDPDDWENGAFIRNAKGHPDYGWGVYNTITHDVVGDSLYLLKKADGTIYKIWIKVKTYAGAAPVWIFRYANLDGSGQQEITLNCTNYTTKNFIYFSLNVGLPIDREPPAADWDIQFTKYMAIHPTGSPYIVTGVLSNYNVGANKYTGVPRSFNDWDQQAFDPGRSVIGYDWKTFDMGTFSYIVDDSTVFFIQDQAGDVYKLYFTAFAGSSSGKVMLYKEKMSTAGIASPEASLQAMVYPNPASGQTWIRLGFPYAETAEISLHDLQGKQLYHSVVPGQGEESVVPVPLEGLSNGIYVLRVLAGNQSFAQKLIVTQTR